MTYFTELSAGNYPAIQHNMLTDQQQTSFVDAMGGFRGGKVVDVYALTEVSAIPIADAIRGFHQEAGLPTPNIVTIPANSTNSRLKEPREADVIFIAGIKLYLGGQVEGASVGLIDQFVGSGRTLNLAEAMLYNAGAEHVRAYDKAWWYDQAVPSEVDVKRITSQHAAFMHDIGRQAAKLVQLHPSTTVR